MGSAFTSGSSQAACLDWSPLSGTWEVTPGDLPEHATGRADIYMTEQA